MSSSEYVASFFLVILGFAVAEVLKGSARLIRERRKIKFYWPYLVAVPLVFEVLIVVFIFLFRFVDSHADASWSLPEIVGVTLVVAPFALSSYLLFPSQIEEGFDVRKFYLENAKFIIIINSVESVVVLVYTISVVDWVGMGIQLTYLTLTTVVFIRFEKLHIFWLFSVIALVNFSVMIGAVSIGR